MSLYGPETNIQGLFVYGLVWAAAQESKTRMAHII